MQEVSSGVSPDTDTGGRFWCIASSRMVARTGDTGGRFWRVASSQKVARSRPRSVDGSGSRANNDIRPDAPRCRRSHLKAKRAHRPLGNDEPIALTQRLILGSEQ